MATTQTAPQTAPTAPTSLKSLPWPFPTDFLRNHTVDEILEDRMVSRANSAANYELAEINENATVAQAFDKLRADDVTALPCFREEGGKKEYTNLINILSLAAFTIFMTVWDELEDRDFRKAESEAERDQRRARMVKDHMSNYFTRPVKDVVGFHAESFKLHTLPRTASALDLVNIMKDGVHHVLIPPQGDQDADIVSQGDLVRWLTSERHDDLSLRQLWQIGVDTATTYALKFEGDGDPNQLKYPDGRWTGRQRRYALHMPDNLDAIIAFKSMMVHHLSSVAIVDSKDGTIKANLSATDLRAITPDNVLDVFRPVMEYMSTLPDRREEPVTISRHNTIKDAINKCLQYDVHRVWEVDDETKKPMGNFSLTDMICCLLPLDAQKEE
ncbi:hypothetical protein SpCBS45565_g08054 [Spizellomyces sp. 'palustris']|nr:hypothetical protein SpCBS45565_g08054 [Spizellomyces sp. 'palustris']